MLFDAGSTQQLKSSLTRPKVDCKSPSHNRWGSQMARFVRSSWQFGIELKKWFPMRVQLFCSRAVLEETAKPRRGLKQLLCSDRKVILDSSIGDGFSAVGKEKPK
jgi:hypothetical protein